MEEHDDWLAQRFEENRTHMRAVAYRMLGSISEADDAVQQTWLRLSRSDTSGIENLGGWLTTVVGRVCLDMLRSRRSRREGPLGVHVPEPIVSRADGIDPEHEALLIDSVSLALLAVLDPDVVLRSDGGLTRPGLSRELRGAAAVAEQALTFAMFVRSARTRPALVNGAAGIVSWSPDGRPFSVMGFTVRDGKIVEIEVIADPERLSRLDLALLDD
jgi:hypothetical protein